MHIRLLHKSHLTDTMYLHHLLRKTKYTFNEYTNYCSKVGDSSLAVYIDNVWETMAIDMLPYLFTISTLSSNEFRNFITFYWQYAKIANIDCKVIRDYLYAKQVTDPCTVFLKLIQTDIACLLSSLIVMQYYFL